ncbi:MAG: hypothetical protein WBN77_15580 [Desulfobacterales bacterium]
MPKAGKWNIYPFGLYELPRRSGEAHLYRFNHPLEAIVSRAKDRQMPPAEIHFDYGQHDGKVSVLEPFIGQSGWLNAWFYTVESLDQEAEDHLIIAAVTDDEHHMDDKTTARLLSLPGNFIKTTTGEKANGDLDTTLEQRQTAIQKEISERNARFFEAEADKLDGWADDLKIGLEREIKELDRQIKEARRAATAALTLEENLAGQKQIKALEAQRNQKRRSFRCPG